MKKSDRERKVKALISVWRQEEPQRGVPNEQLHCSDFIRWLRIHYPELLKFKGTLSVEDQIELWFDNELKQRWRI